MTNEVHRRKADGRRCRVLPPLAPTDVMHALAIVRVRWLDANEIDYLGAEVLEADFVKET